MAPPDFATSLKSISENIIIYRQVNIGILAPNKLNTKVDSQLAITCSKSTTEILEQGKKYVQN